MSHSTVRGDLTPPSRVSMAPKRSSGDADLPMSRTRESSIKRNKTSAPLPLPHESSRSSTMSSEKRPSEDTAPISVSSSRTSLSEVDSESASDSQASQDSSSADDEADAEYEDEDERAPAQVTSHPRPLVRDVASKPKIDPNLVMAYAKELEAKLHAFLPQLRQANNNLSEQSAKLNMEHVNESEQHIEMNLDLGVLEQQQPSDTAQSTGHIKLRPEHTSGEEQELLPRDVSVTRLLSGQSDQAKPSIEVVEPDGTVHDLPQRPGPVPS